MKNRAYLALLLIFAATAIVVFFKATDIETSVPNQPLATSTPTEQIVTVRLEFSEADKEEIKLNYSSPITAFDALQELVLKKDIDLQSQKYDFGVFIKSIAGYVNSADKAWIFYINGNSADKAADKYELRHGDVVEWKYIQPI